MVLPSPVQRMVLDNQELILNRLKDIRKVNLRKEQEFLLGFFFIASTESPFLQKKWVTGYPLSRLKGRS